jgi:hypothetical protein
MGKARMPAAVLDWTTVIIDSSKEGVNRTV